MKDYRSQRNQLPENRFGITEIYAGNHTYSHSEKTDDQSQPPVPGCWLISYLPEKAPVARGYKATIRATIPAGTC